MRPQGVLVRTLRELDVPVAQVGDDSAVRPGGRSRGLRAGVFETSTHLGGAASVFLCGTVLSFLMLGGPAGRAA